MPSSNQKKIEDIIIALIQTQSPFTTPATAPVLNYDADGDTVSSRSRVVVRASEPVPIVPGFKPDSPAPVLQSDVEISIRLATSSSSTLDTWEAAVDAALATAPAAVITAALASYPNGFKFDDVAAGSRQPEGAENRERTKTVRVVIGV